MIEEEARDILKILQDSKVTLDCPVSQALSIWIDGIVSPVRVPAGKVASIKAGRLKHRNGRLF